MCINKDPEEDETVLETSINDPNVPPLIIRNYVLECAWTPLGDFLQY